MVKFTPRNFRKAVMAVCKLLIIFAAVGIFMYTVFTFYPQAIFPKRGNIILTLLYLAIFYIFIYTYDSFRIGHARLTELVFCYALSVALSDFIFYFVLSLIAESMLVPWMLLLAMAVQLVVGVLLYVVADRAYFKLYPARSTVIICSDDPADMSVVQKFCEMKKHYDICAVCHESAGIDEITATIGDNNTVVIGSVSRELRSEIMSYCFENDKRLFVTPTIQDIIFHEAGETFISDSLLYLCRNRSFSLEQLALKRIFDIFVSVFGLVITSPVMLVVAIIIKMYDGGPVFFKQVRYTRNLKPFTLVKFRSMIVDAEKDGAQFTVDDDPRITPIGRFIRATRIDELPQFVNILKGEMSLVGPRAERIENVQRYCELMPEFRYRMKVKAGLTGFAQVYGRYNTSYEDKLKMDLLYIEHCSLMTDLRILFVTVKVMFIKESTSGFDVQTLDEFTQELENGKENKE